MELMTRTLAGMEAFLSPPGPLGLQPPRPPPGWGWQNSFELRPFGNSTSEQSPTGLARPAFAAMTWNPTILPAPLEAPTFNAQSSISEKQPEPENLLPEQFAKEATTMSETFSDKNVTTVQYQILFIKRDYETILLDARTIVTQHLSADGFIAWRIADFISGMARHGIPLNRDQARTLGPLPGAFFKPPFDPCDKDWPPHGALLMELSNENNQYLRVEFQVLSAVSREDANYDEDQTKALQTIARRMPDSCDEKPITAGYSTS